MKRLLKLPLHFVWRITAPLRRPIARSLRDFLTRIHREAIAQDMQAQQDLLNSVLPQLRRQDQVLTEMSLCLDSMTRELVRLQLQVEALTETKLAANRAEAA